MSKYNISYDSFSSKVASEVIDYFAEVLKQQKPVGHCPIMNDFIDFMYSKNISLKEIFLICMGLRRAIFSMIASIGELEKDNIWIMELFFELFDQNLSGVLEHYDNLILKDQKDECTKEIIDCENHLQTLLDLQDSAIFEIKDERLFLANRAFYELVGVLDIDEFMRIYPDIWSFIESVSFNKEIFKEKKFGTWIEKIINENDGKCEIEVFNYGLNQKVKMEIKICTIDSDRYLGVMSDLSECDLKMSSMVELIYTDDMTQVPNRRRFDEILTIYLKQCKDLHEHFFLFLIDIHDFSDISEILGRDTGDFILKRFARGVLKYFDSNHFFVRIDGNRFALLIKSDSYEGAEKFANKILNELHSITYSNG